MDSICALGGRCLPRRIPLSIWAPIMTVRRTAFLSTATPKKYPTRTPSPSAVAHGELSSRTSSGRFATTQPMRSSAPMFPRGTGASRLQRAEARIDEAWNSGDATPSWRDASSADGDQPSPGGFGLAGIRRYSQRLHLNGAVPNCLTYKLTCETKECCRAGVPTGHPSNEVTSQEAPCAAPNTALRL